MTRHTSYHEESYEYPQHEQRPILHRHTSRGPSQWSYSDTSSVHAALEYDASNVLTRYEAEPHQALTPCAKSSASSPASENGWTWDNAKQSRYYISSDGQTKIWCDGTRESLHLRPPPLAQGPVRIFDTQRNLLSWRDETAKCWRWEDGTKMDDRPS
jgi:hypothetical protein